MPMNRLFAAIALFFICETALAGELEQIESVKLKGNIAKSKDISGLGIVGDFLVIGSDETNRCQILKATDRGYALLADSDVVLADDGKEVDIEGIACEGKRVYAIGSHALVRPKLEKGESYRKNREQIERIRFHPSRDLLASFTLGEDGKASSIRKASLRSVIEANPILRPFARIPANENGVNIEGLAVKEGRLYVGFRGPILRGNYVPVLACDFDHVESAHLLWVNLEGLGVRDLAGTKEGFLILAGPMGDGPGSFKLFSWNGRDCLPGVERPDNAGEIKELCRIPHEENAKAEGIAITQENESFYEFLIAFDGLKNGGIKRFRLSKP
jgi:hypothetical protein